jgi:hypothetical protein
LKFKEGAKIRHLIHNKVLEIFSIDFNANMYIVKRGECLMAVSVTSLDMWYEELLPVEQELW